MEEIFKIFKFILPLGIYLVFAFIVGMVICMPLWKLFKPDNSDYSSERALDWADDNKIITYPVSVFVGVGIFDIFGVFFLGKSILINYL